MELNVLHVGGRWGSVPFLEGYGALKKSINLVTVEADSHAIPSMAKVLENRGYNKVAIINKAIWSYTGQGVININFDGNSSSVFLFDNRYADFSVFIRKFSKGLYRLGVGNETQKRVEVEFYTLADLESLIAEDLKPTDALSLDVEGGTMEVLRGLSSDQLDNLCLVAVEGSLLCTKTGETGFTEIAEFLFSRGFFLVDLGGTERASPSILHAGMFDKGVIMGFSDSIFLRDPSKLSTPRSLYALAIFSILNGCLSIASLALKRASQISPDFFRLSMSHNKDASIALKFLSDFWSLFSILGDIPLPQISETHTYQDFNQLFFKYGPPSEPQAGKGTFSFYVAHYKRLLKLFNMGRTYSTLYRKYGFEKLGNEAEDNEREQIEFYERFLLRFAKNAP